MKFFELCLAYLLQNLVLVNYIVSSTKHEVEYFDSVH